MRCSYYAVVAAMLQCVVTLVAGGNEARHVAFKHSPVPYMRGPSSGCNCETNCSATTPCDTACDSACGSSCVTCRDRLPPLLPALVDSFDCIVQRLYYNPCNIPCCRQRCRPTSCMDIWFGYRSDCGCNSCGTESWPATAPVPKNVPMPTNPFKDDELQAPPSVPKDLGFKRATPKLQPVEHRRPKYSSEPTVIAPVKVVAVTEKIRASEPVVVARPRPSQLVRPVKHETPSKMIIPKNPLRSE